MSNSLERWFSNKKSNSLFQIEDPFDRLMNEMLTLKRENFQPTAFMPSCEITEEGPNYVLKFDMPGVSRDQVKVEVNKDQLMVHAERKEEKKHESKKKFLSEIYYGSYSRNFTLPGGMDEKKVDAKFENGVLTITVPKSDTLQAKQIPIN